MHARLTFQPVAPGATGVIDRGLFAAEVGPPGRRYRRCANRDLATCNWMVAEDGPGPLCASCALTRVRPNDADADGIEALRHAESAKRRLLFQLGELGLPVVDRVTDPERGLAFDLLASHGDKVTTGHADGVITLDLSESDDAYREGVRVDLGEPYRTVLGHLRHEIGHYEFNHLVGADDLPEARTLFGDETANYQDALDRHPVAPVAEVIGRHVARHALGREHVIGQRPHRSR